MPRNITDVKRDHQKKIILEFLEKPENKNKIISINMLAQACGMSFNTIKNRFGMAWISEEWIKRNPDAPERVKAHFRTLAAANSYDYSNPDTIIIRKTDADGKRTAKHYSVTEEVAGKTTMLLGHKFKQAMKEKEEETGEKISVEVINVAPRTKHVSQRDFEIHRIKEAYIRAEIGATPSVSRIMRDFGMIDKNGRVMTADAITEDEVRQRMQDEGWKADRERHLHRMFDVIPDEVKMVTLVRNLEVQKLLFEEIKVVHRSNMQWYASGEVRSLDGKKVLDYKPDHSVLAALAETMRRMTTTDQASINILIQNNQARVEKGEKVAIATKSVMNEISAMSETQIMAEIERYEALNSMLTKKENTIIDVENQNIRETKNA